MQDLIVYAIVAGATFYLGKMLWGSVSGKKAGCGSCSSPGCGSKSAANRGRNVPRAQQAPLIQIEMTNLNGLNRLSKK